MKLDEGRVSIGEAIAQFTATHIAVGIGTTPPTPTDSELEFEVYRGEITSRAYDPVTGRVVFKTVIPDNVEASIAEVALIQSEGGYEGSTMLFSANPASEEWAGGTWATGGVRIGAEGLQVSGGEAVLDEISHSMTEYDPASELQLAYNGSGAGDVTVQLRTDDTNYFEYTFTAAEGFNVHSIRFADTIRVGVPDDGLIQEISVAHAGTGSVVLDALRVRVSNDDSTFIDRSLVDPIHVKQQGRSLDVEVPLVIA